MIEGPLFKDSREKPGDYRAVNPTLIVGKLLQKFLIINDHLERWGSEITNMTNMIGFFEEIAKCIDEGRWGLHGFH